MGTINSTQNVHLDDTQTGVHTAHCQGQPATTDQPMVSLPSEFKQYVNNVHIQADIQIFITAAGGEGKM